MFKRGDKPKSLIERTPGLLGRYIGGTLGQDGPSAVREWESQLAEAERVTQGAHRLWQREFAAITVRGLLKSIDPLEPAWQPLLERCRKLREHMRALDEGEFAPLRARVADKTYGPDEFRRELSARGPPEWDAFSERLLGIHDVPDAERELGIDMVHYLPSKMEVIADVIQAIREDGPAHLGEGEVFYDLGSGLGKVSMLAGWLLDIRAKGVELDPAYVRAAERRARELRFDRVEMICADAREVDYSDGTVFFLYDPFRGEVLTAVLERLREVSTRHPVVILSRGNTNAALLEVEWLERTRTLASDVTVFVPRRPG